ncbi:tetratricopeptide repeat protein [Gimesia aquarii]|uniref:Tol-pal system protein YbgF n=1 Tax=Gimesia aquarii TaxID=2527964 RepID=A0A517W437_9PLAN|nr:tetratricopeptide repeat protein [Gimesia aquarii]QDU00022.1 tol-pal system protein YbgF [Gimesia aquarii]
MMMNNRIRPLFSYDLRIGKICLIFLAFTFLPVQFALADKASDEFQLAIGLYKQNRWELATETFQKYLKNYPKHASVPLAKFYLGLTLVNQQKYREARDVLRNFVKEYPQNQNRPDALYRIGECSYLLDDLEAADKEFTEFLKLHPKHALEEWAYPYFGDVMLRRGKSEMAVKSFQRSLERHPKGAMREDAEFGLASAYLQNKQPAEAEKRFKEIADKKNHSRASDAQMSLATSLFDRKQFKAAANAFLEIPEKFPESPLGTTARLNAGYAFYDLNEYTKAIEQFDLVAKDPKQTANALYWKGVSLKGAQKFPEAIAALEQTLKSKPSPEQKELATYQLADTLLRSGEPAKAKPLFLDFIKQWPTSDLADDSLHFAIESALLNDQLTEAAQLAMQFEKEYPQSGLRLHQELLKGRIRDALGTPDDLKIALAHFQNVLAQTKLENTKLLARLYLARTFQKLNQFDKSVEVLEPYLNDPKVNKQSSEYADALVLQSSSFNSLKKYAEAETLSTEYLKQFPNGPRVNQILANLIIITNKNNKPQEVDKYLDQLKARKPDTELLLQTYSQLAERNYEQKQWKRAKKFFAEIVKAGLGTPEYPAALSGLAWSEFQLEEYPSAAKHFEQFVKEFPESPLAAEATFMQGRSLEDNKQLEAATTVFQNALTKFAPSRYAMLSGLQAARTLFKLNKIDAVNEAYETLLQKFPKPDNLDKILDEWALINYEAERFEMSDTIFQRLVQETPNSDLADNARLSLAESELIAGKLQVAAKAFDELQASAKSDEKVQQVSLYRLIEIYLELKKWDLVEKFAKELLKRFPKNEYASFAQFHQAEAALYLNQTKTAQEELLKIVNDDKSAKLSQEPWYPRAWVLLAETYFRQKKYDDVQKTVERFRSWDAKNPFLYQAEEVLGRSLKNQAKFEEARKVFQKITESENSRRTETAAKCQFLLAETLMIQEKFKAALLAYLQVDIQYKFPEWQAPALFQAGTCHEALNEWTQALKTYQDFLKRFPEHELVPRAKERMKAVQAKVSRNK